MIERLITTALELSSFAFDLNQKRAIHRRDNDKCQFPAEHKCGGRQEIHHIKPQSYLSKFGVDPDYPENGILICRTAHHMIHPDMAEADKHYHEDHNAYKKAHDHHEELLREKKIFWNPEWDRQMEVQAVKNTQRAERSGHWFWPFPGRKK